MSQSDFTTDAFLGGKLSLKQPKEGYRATADAVLLSSAISPKDKDASVLDVGTGTGIIALCLKSRHPSAKVTGIDIQPELLAIAKENASLNHLDIDFILGNIKAPPAELKNRSFDFIITNPPYATEDTPSPFATKALAYHELSTSLADWLAFCLKRLKPKGTLALIHRTDRLPEILGALGGKLGGITIIPIYPSAGKPANRVIIKGLKNSRTPLTLSQGLVMHEAGGALSTKAEEILRHGHTLESVL